MSVEAIITQVAAIQATITGVKRAHDKAPESLSELPAFVNFPADGEITRPGTNTRQTTHKIAMQLMVARGDLPSAEAELRPFIARVISAFDQHLTLSSTCTSSGVVNYKYGKVSYAGVDYLGIVFTLQATERETVVFQP